MNLTIEHKEGRSFTAKGSKGEFLLDEHIASAQEYFVAGMLACSGVDIVELAKKNGTEVKNLSLKAEMVRSEKKPNKFDEAHIIYGFECDADAMAARRWVLASIETYCTTINSIRDSVKITYSIVYNGAHIAEKDEIISAVAYKATHGKYEDFSE